MLTAVQRYYDLMCQSRSLSPTSLLHSLVSLCSLDHLLLVFRTFPTLALRIFLWMLGPLPRLSQQCTCPFLPAERRSSPTIERVDTSLLPRQRLLPGPRFRGCSHSLMFRPPGFACHPGRSYRRGEATRPVAAMAFTSEHRMSCYLLTRRIC